MLPAETRNIREEKAMKEKRFNKREISKYTSKYGIFLTLLVLIMACSVASPKFLTTSNALNVLRQTSVYCLIALAEGIVIISGGIDLAAGSTMALAGIASIPVCVATDSILLGVLTAVGIGILCSGISGVITAFLDMPAFVVTLALQMAIRGFIMVRTLGVTVAKTGGKFKILGQGFIGGVIPTAIVVMVLAVIAADVLLRYTRIGRNLFALGGNREAAFASGINIRMYTIISYVISGVFAGLAGYMYMSRINSGVPSGAEGYESNGISAAVIGGVAFTGGSGSAWGIMIGAMILCIITNILNLVGVDGNAQKIVNGAIIVLAVAIDMQTKRRR